MATTVTVSASMRTRKTTSSSNFNSAAAQQEFYTDDYNFVGIVNFPGLNLLNKVVTAIQLKVTAANAGYGASVTKTVYVRESLYQAASQSGITGANYYGPALGTFTGSFYGNVTTNTLSGSLLTAFASYLSAGNNTICLFNPSPVESSSGWAENYMKWDACQIIVTYEEAANIPTTSAESIDLGSTVTIYTNRPAGQSSTHVIKYEFEDSSGTIATGILDSTTWAPSISLASQLPSSTSGICTITCETYYNEILTGTKTCQLLLVIPASVIPTISSVVHTEAVAGLAAQFGSYVRNKSRITVSISADQEYGSPIVTYRSTLNGVLYSGSSFTSEYLSVSGSNTLSVTVTDDRGRTSAAENVTITVTNYSPPLIAGFSAERCNAGGTAYQQDGVNVRINLSAGVSSVGAHNTMTCSIYRKLASASTWTLVQSITPVNFSVSAINFLLSGTFDALSSYDLKAVITDYFTSDPPVSQTYAIRTKKVIMDFYDDGEGMAIGKVAEQTGVTEMAWPLVLSAPLSEENGGLGASTFDAGRANLGVNLRTFYSVAQLGQTVGSATVNDCFTQMSNGSLLIASSSDFANLELPVAGTLGTFVISRISVGRAFCFCIGKIGINALYRKVMASDGYSFADTWYRVYDGTDPAAVRNELGLGNTIGALPAENGGTGTTSLGALLTLLEGLGAWSGFNMTIKHGNLTATSAGVSVTFDAPFPGTPFIMPVNHGSTPTALSTTGITVSGFTARSAASTGSFEWLAICIPGITYTPS